MTNRPNRITCCQAGILEAHSGLNGARFVRTPVSDHDMLPLVRPDDLHPRLHGSISVVFCCKRRAFAEISRTARTRPSRGSPSAPVRAIRARISRRLRPVRCRLSNLPGQRLRTLDDCSPAGDSSGPVLRKGLQRTVRLCRFRRRRPSIRIHVRIACTGPAHRSRLS
jgi:hypothetical protein